MTYFLCFLVPSCVPFWYISSKNYFKPFYRVNFEIFDLGLRFLFWTLKLIRLYFLQIYCQNDHNDVMILFLIARQCLEAIQREKVLAL